VVSATGFEPVTQ